MWEGDIDTVLQKAELLRLKMNNPYIHYHLEQQHGRGIPMFRGSFWQRRYGQKGYGLGGLFRSLGKIAKPMIKSGAKALGNIPLTSGMDLLGDVLAGKSVKQAARARALEGANVAKMQAIQRAQRYAQTGRGRSKSAKRSTKRSAKKRKASPSVTKCKPVSKRERLLETYLVNYEFRARQIGGVYENGTGFIFCSADASEFGKRLWIDHQPVSSVSDAGPITFLCLGTEDYTDLSKTILVVRAKVTKANGNDLNVDEKVGSIINNFLHSLFKQVDVFLKEKQVTQVTQATGRYAHRAYVETLLNYGSAAWHLRPACSIRIRPERWRSQTLHWQLLTPIGV